MNTTAKTTNRVISSDMLANLPEPVKRYMTYTGVIGKAWTDTVHLKYAGQFRLGADRPWLPISADQVYTTNPPGFQWKAHLKMAGLPLMYGQDTYKDGQGHMFGKFAGLFTIFDARGDELLQATMLRFLQEMTWFPIAFLSDYIGWQPVDDHAADVTFTYVGKTVRARMYFDDEGRLLTFIAQRYREHQGNFTLNTWAAPVTEYGTFDGLRVPVAGCGMWYLSEGDLPYVKVGITEIHYNQPIWTF